MDIVKVSSSREPHITRLTLYDVSCQKIVSKYCPILLFQLSLRHFSIFSFKFD